MLSRFKARDEAISDLAKHSGLEVIGLIGSKGTVSTSKSRIKLHLDTLSHHIEKQARPEHPPVKVAGPKIIMLHDDGHNARLELCHEAVATQQLGNVSLNAFQAGRRGRKGVAATCHGMRDCRQATRC